MIIDLPIIKKRVDPIYLLKELRDMNWNWKEWAKIRLHNLCPGPHLNLSDYKALLTWDDIWITPTDPSQNYVWGDNMWQEYHFTDITRDDVVLDVGANIGAFSLRAAKMSDNVHAVEPLWADILRKNLEMNPNLADKITVHEVAIGDGKPALIQFGREKWIETITLKDLIKEIGGITFLKMDIEGWEYGIPLDHFDGINRIELEHHEHVGIALPVNPALSQYLHAHWDCEVDPKNPAWDGKYFHCYPKGGIL